MEVSFTMKITVNTDQIPEESRETVEDVRQYVRYEMGWVEESGIHLDWIQSQLQS